MTLKAAREEHTSFKELLAKGIDPSQYRQEQRQQEAIAATNNFESIARQWWNHWKHDKTERRANYTISRLEQDVFPVIGGRPINGITTPTLLTIIKRIESRGALDIAKRALNTCGQIIRYAVAHKLAEHNPVADIKSSDVLKPTKKANYARLDQKDLPILLQRIDEYDGQLLTKFALQLMTLTFVRTSELLGARWDEIEMPNNENTAYCTFIQSGHGSYREHQESGS